MDYCGLDLAGVPCATAVSAVGPSVGRRFATVLSTVTVVPPPLCPRWTHSISEDPLLTEQWHAMSVGVAATAVSAVVSLEIRRRTAHRAVAHIVRQCHPADPYEMRKLLAALKRPVSATAHAHLVHRGDTRWLDHLTVQYPSRRVFRFWQPGGGFDHNIFREKTVPAVINYIHENPVRRGLVNRPTDWVWSSARFWNGFTNVPLRMDEPFV